MIRKIVFNVMDRVSLDWFEDSVHKTFVVLGHDNFTESLKEIGHESGGLVNMLGVLLFECGENTMLGALDELGMLTLISDDFN